MQMLLKHFETIMRHMPPEARGAPAFQIQNVYEWVWPEDDKWDWRKNVFTAAPPYRWMWLEFTDNRHRIITNVPQFKHWGGLVEGWQVPSAEDFERSLDTDARNYILKGTGGEVPGWVIVFYVYLGIGDRLLELGPTLIVADEMGQVLEPELSYHPRYLPKWGHWGDVKACFVKTCLAAITLMHLKNIRRVPVTVPPKIRKKRNARGIPDIRFETLAIEPFRQRFQREYKKNPNGPSAPELAFHLVRGHFKDYRERGLFGNPNLRGIYWWDSHARGNEKNGIIIKDYEVKTQ